MTFLACTSLLIALALASDPYGPQNKCRPGDICWPTQAEIEALIASLNPEMNRTLYWKGPPAPVPTWIPQGASEPLFGIGVNMKPLYAQVGPKPMPCLFGGDPNATEMCKMATREAPREGWEPAFVAWPLTAGHVQALVKFAVKHSLCVAVAGTGGDFINRHSCDQGLMIRMALMKDLDWDLNDSRGLGHASVRMGPGNTFAEVQYSGSLQSPSSYIAAGWGQSVGVVGWHLGGGHGPFIRSKGLGVDNLLEVEIVLADGTIAIANARNNSDLFWALRGGGGSTWGVITALTSRAHTAPAGGFTDVGFGTSEGLCGKDTDAIAENFTHNINKLSKKWGYVTTFGVQGEKPSWKNLFCGRQIGGFGDFVYLGGQNETEFQEGFQLIKDALRGLVVIPLTPNSYKNWIDHYATVPISTDQYTNGAPFSGEFCKDTYLIQEEGLTRMTDRVKTTLKHTAVGEATEFQVYAWQGANNPMAAPDGATSISPKARGAEWHFWSPRDVGPDLSAASYFSESRYLQVNGTWKAKYWGSNYPHLLAIKQKYDPNGVFWCHNCVGSNDLGMTAAEASVMMI